LHAKVSVIVIYVRFATVVATTLKMTATTVLAVAIFSLATTLSARETHTETFYPDHPVSGQTSIEIILDTKVRVISYGR